MENKNKSLTVLAMGYYGNRTLIDCSEGQIDEVLTGATKEIREILKIIPDRKFVALPDTDCYVLYNGNAKVDEYSKVVCSVPNVVDIYDRCIFCRKEGDKVLSITTEDLEKINKYIAR
jgi:hypothetical protein